MGQVRDDDDDDDDDDSALGLHSWSKYQDKCPPPPPLLTLINYDVDLKIITG